MNWISRFSVIGCVVISATLLSVGCSQPTTSGKAPPAETTGDDTAPPAPSPPAVSTISASAASNRQNALRPPVTAADPAKVTPGGTTPDTPPPPAAVADPAKVTEQAPATPPKPTEPAHLELSSLEPQWRKFLEEATTHYRFTEAQRASAQTTLDRCLTRAAAAEAEFQAASSKGDAARPAAVEARDRALKKLDDEIYGRIHALASMEQIQKAVADGWQSPALLRAPKRPDVGQDAPPFELRDAQGQAVSLASLRGKVVVVHFWATWCGYCKKVLPEIQKIHDAFKDQPDVVVLGVNCAPRPTAPDAQVFFKEQGYTYRILLNGDRVSSAYEVRGFPALFVIGPDGKIIFKEPGAKPDQAARVVPLIQGTIKKT